MAKIKNGCSIYIKFGSRKVKLPVNPEEIEIKYPTDHKTYSVIGIGEIVVPRNPSLKVVSWESFFLHLRMTLMSMAMQRPQKTMSNILRKH